MTRTRASFVARRFARQAKAFSGSPLQRDPERLRRLLEFLAGRPGERVLDVGCGPGIVTAALRSAGMRAVGIDLTAAMLREARAAGVTCVQGDVSALPFQRGAFDVAVSRNTFHHLADPRRVLEEMARTVRSGGRVVIEDMEAPADAAQRAYHETVERLRDPAHARTLTRGEFRDLGAAAGLAAWREEPIVFVIDFEEWLARGFAVARDRRRARTMMEACLERDRIGLRVWRDAGRLMFERRSLMLSAPRP